MYLYISVANSPGMLSMRRMLKNKNDISKNSKIIFSPTIYYYLLQIKNNYNV